MRNHALRILLSFTLIFLFVYKAEGIDSLKYCISLNYYRDLSDTYDGGDLFMGEFNISRSWYGVSISYGYFQSYSVFKYQVFIEEINKSLSIPFDEVTIMKSTSISLLMIPIQNKFIRTDILFGVAYGQAKSLQFHDLDYSYSFQENKFNYLYKNYELVKQKHIGYQFGLNVIFSITKKIGLQLNSRIQDLNHGGTFFFVGTGICFRF